MAHFLGGLIAFLGYFGGGVALAVIYVLLYVRITPHREFDLIVKEHNASAAIALSSSLVGFVVPMARAVAQATSIVEFAAWGLVALVVQIGAYYAARLAHPNLSQAIEENSLSAAIWLGAVSLSAGLLSAAAMTE
jgi:putative membrane protein